MYLREFLSNRKFNFFILSLLVCVACYLMGNLFLTGALNDFYVICLLPLIFHPFLTLLYVFITFVFLVINFKNRQDMKCYGVISASVLFLLVAIFSIQDITYTSFSTIVSFVFLFISLIALTSVLFVITYVEKLNVYSCYFAVIVPLGLIYYFAILPWSAPDAVRHMAATYRFSNIVLGQEEWSARKIDSDFFENVWINYKDVSLDGYRAVLDNIKNPADSEKTEELSIKDTDMTCYSFISYLPLVAGVVTGRLFTLNTLQTAYLSKLFMFVFYVFGVFLAIKIIPRFKYTIAMIAVLPISLMYASGISYDGMVIVTTLNFIASLFAFSEKSNQFNLLMLCLWTFLMISCKGGGYILLLPLIFGMKKKSIALILGVTLLSLLIFNNFLYTTQPMFQLNKNIDVNLYTSWAFGHPLEYMSLVFNTYKKHFFELSFQLLGSKLGWLQPTIDREFITVLFVIMILAANKEGIGIKNGYTNIFLWIFVLFIAILTIPLLLLCETPKDADFIFGVQGRYFLPFLPVFMFLVGGAANKLPVKVKNIIEKININAVFLCFTVVSYICVYCMMQSFWRAA